MSVIVRRRLKFRQRVENFKYTLTLLGSFTEPMYLANPKENNSVFCALLGWQIKSTLGVLANLRPG